MSDVFALFTPIVAAIAYSCIIYAKKTANPENPVEFEPIKFLSTVTVGVVLGVISVGMEIPVTQMGIEEMFLLYGGAVILIESVLKGLWRFAARVPSKQEYF